MTQAKPGTIPRHWKTNTWEEKARENPLFAVMSTPEMQDASAEAFDGVRLELFFDKGRSLAQRLIDPVLPDLSKQGLVVEYGCGAGRILNALVERGLACAGIDISPTMLKHCARLVPGVESLHALDDQGRCDLPNECARLVFSYAVVQHIDRLSAYERALGEMCRLLQRGGRLVLQVNCEDFALARDGRLGRTENLEEHSLHFAPDSTQPQLHRHSTWSGVYIGRDRLITLLERGGVEVLSMRNFNPSKARSVLVVGKR